MNTNSTCTTSKLALDHATIKALFAANATPSLCSEQAYRYAQLSEQATDLAERMALAAVGRAFNEQRHALRVVRDFGPASPMALEHALARDRALAEIGL